MEVPSESDLIKSHCEALFLVFRSHLCYRRLGLEHPGASRDSTSTVHVQNDAIIDASIGIRCAYLLAAGCSSALALAGTVIAVRTIIMININKAADVPQLLNYVYHQRLNSQFHSYTHARPLEDHWTAF